MKFYNANFNASNAETSKTSRDASGPKSSDPLPHAAVDSIDEATKDGKPVSWESSTVRMILILGPFNSISKQGNERDADPALQNEWNVTGSPKDLHVALEIFAVEDAIEEAAVIDSDGLSLSALRMPSSVSCGSLSNEAARVCRFM